MAISLAESRGNRILGNVIFANDRVGINLGLDFGTTPNDPRDTDAGPNDVQNFPVLIDATIAGGRTTITGTLDSTPRSTYLVQFFAHPFNAEGSSLGQSFLGQKQVATNNNGHATFSFTTTRRVFPGDLVTATATDRVTANTSEFAELVQAKST